MQLVPIRLHVPELRPLKTPTENEIIYFNHHLDRILSFMIRTAPPLQPRDLSESHYEDLVNIIVRGAVDYINSQIIPNNDRLLVRREYSLFTTDEKVESRGRMEFIIVYQHQFADDDSIQFMLGVVEVKPPGSVDVTAINWLVNIRYRYLQSIFSYCDHHCDNWSTPWIHNALQR